MARGDTEKLGLARQIVAGSRTLTAPELMALAYDLSEENQIGYARRVYQVALSQAPVESRDQAQIKLALTTYKDPDLPIDDRLKTAESLLLEVLSRAESLSVPLHQETLGILGAVHKRRWSGYGHKDDLEKAAFYYRGGYQLGIASDFGYTALNLAFVLDLMADAAGGLAGAPEARTAESWRIREEIVATLPGLLRDNTSLESQWWFACTLGEAYLGLRRFDEALAWVRRAAAEQPDNWRVESTVRQMAHIVRLQCKADGLPLARWSEAPSFAVLSGLLGGNAAAAMSFFLGKAGLALSGGGFRASLFHIGVLARLADLDMLRHIEVISSVSGGSILAAYYCLELRALLESKPDTQITREDYIRLVKNVETGFLEGVQRNIRLRMILEPGSNWKVLSSRTSTTTDRLADLYERELYARVEDEFCHSPRRFIQDLLIHPAGVPPGTAFAPRYENWTRLHKVPILIVNATTLNTCHNWQFTATYMGEAPLRAIDVRIDGNDRLRRMYYEEAPPAYRRLRLGQAVAASACVPGLFDPLVLEPLYPHYATKLVDGGVFDNQGLSSLLGEDCTVLIISDASGQTALAKDPASGRISVSLRSNNVLMARGRQEEYQLISALADAGLLRGVAYIHLKKDLDAHPVDWIDCPDPSTPQRQALLTTYGIRKDVQAALAAIRTDLDAFSDAEADALMLSGYRMMQEEFAASIHGFPVAAPQSPDWRFLRIEKLACALSGSLELDAFKKALHVARASTFKPYRLSTAVKVLTWASAAAVLIGFVFLLRSMRGYSVSVAGLLAAVVLLAATGAAVKLVLHRVLHNPNPLWQILAAIPLVFLGWPLTWFWTRFLDPVYLRSGPRCRGGASPAA
jgi:predicted acylesterase/phospholipase RssA